MMNTEILTLKDIESIGNDFKRVLLGSKLKFLIVDDSAIGRKMVAAILQRLNYSNIEVAKNGLDAIAKLKTIIGPVVVLLDINMPVMDGLSFLEQIQDEIKSRPTLVFVMSTNKKRSTVLRSIELGAKGYLCKPFTPAQVAEKLRDIYSFFD